ncbi:hypothetical protein DFP72DRAFT_1073301 [Ephemerocybe angulata]|uniref:Uncharacterized protein n=1 Tax=Ephemerocybe angulata TaxID=980116 RepID=A0A8H6HPK1_9AGAR|nr:hypothetical protein DFP72DRAFT_1073301 [Tulosesus angulatus]
MPAGFVPGGPFGKMTMMLGNGTTTSSVPADPHEWIIATFTSHVRRYMSRERAGTIRTAIRKAIDTGDCSEHDNLQVFTKLLSDQLPIIKLAVTTPVAAPSSPSPPSPVEEQLITSVVALGEGLEKMQEELDRLSNEVLTLRSRTEEVQDIASKEAHSLRTSMVEAQDVMDREFAEVNRSLVALANSRAARDAQVNARLAGSERVDPWPDPADPGVGSGSAQGQRVATRPPDSLGLNAVKAEVVQTKSLANCAKRHTDDLRLQVDELAAASRVRNKNIDALDARIAELQSASPANSQASELELSFNQRIDALDARVAEIQSASHVPSPPQSQPLLPPPSSVYSRSRKRPPHHRSRPSSVYSRSRKRPPHHRSRPARQHKRVPPHGAPVFQPLHGTYPIGQCPLCCSPLFVPHPAFRGRRMAMC